MKDILIAFVHMFAMMAPWLVFGFLMAGIVAVWIPRSWVNHIMGGSSGFGGILRAVAIGVPLPICSCGVLPIAAGLRKHGAGKGPTAALLISTPQTGIDSILATYALLGPVFAVARPIAAALVGRKAAAAYVAVIMAGAILCGIAINLVPNALTASAAIAASGHSLSVVHWASAVFLAAMIAYDLVRPVAMGHHKCSSK